MSTAVKKMGATGAVVDACWNKIGVSGDRACGELAVQLRFQNSPVDASSAVTFLDQDMPADYLAELTDYVARGQEREDGGTQAVLIFRLGEEWLALPLLALEDVVERRAIHSLPHRHGGVVLGLVNVRGGLLICVSLTRLMGLNEADRADSNAEGRFLVISDNGQRMAAPVDKVGGIFRYRADELRALPDTVTKGAANFTKATFAWKDKTIGLLDERRVTPALNRSIA